MCLPVVIVVLARFVLPSQSQASSNYCWSSVSDTIIALQVRLVGVLKELEWVSRSSKRVGKYSVTYFELCVIIGPLNKMYNSS